LTIGHSTRTWKAFLDLLRAYRVKRVIDVCSIPRSRHNPQFDQEALRTKLRAARIGYVHLRKLGGLRHARHDSSNMGWRNSSFRGFADYMQTSEFDAGLQSLIKLARQKRSALIWAESVPWRCHRSLIADALTVLGIRVEDIMSKNRSTFSAAWLVIHVCVFLLVLDYLGFLYYLPFLVAELFLGFMTAIWLFGPPAKGSA
jgi:uncharacterized protein (DUF488 family)